MIFEFYRNTRIFGLFVHISFLKHIIFLLIHFNLLNLLGQFVVLLVDLEASGRTAHELELIHDTVLLLQLFKCLHVYLLSSFMLKSIFNAPTYGADGHSVFCNSSFRLKIAWDWWEARTLRKSHIIVFGPDLLIIWDHMTFDFFIVKSI